MRICLPNYVGLHRGNREILRDALLDAAGSTDVVRRMGTTPGEKYRMTFPVIGPGSGALVQAGWMVEPGSRHPRLVTCLVE